MKRPKILHILTFLRSGGAETNLLALLENFDHERFEHSVAFGSTGELEREFSRRCEHLIKLSEKPLSLWSTFEKNKIVEKIATYTPDIIHCHLDAPNLMGVFAKRKWGYKLLFHFHDNGILPKNVLPEGGLAHYLWRPVIMRTYSYCDAAIAICNFQLPFIRKLGIDDNKVALIPNGINVQRFSRKDKPISDMSADNEYSFVNIARFFPQKDHALLVRAFRDVVAVAPQAKLTLIGDGPLRESVEKMVASFNLSENVIFLGIRKDVSELLPSFDCFVLPSRWELHPITILEAMATGLPVIATKVGGVPDTVENGVTGIVIPSGNEKALAHAMLSLLSHPSAGAEMGKEGARRAAEAFDNRRVASEIESVYENMLRGTL